MNKMELFEEDDSSDTSELSGSLSPFPLPYSVASDTIERDLLLLGSFLAEPASTTIGEDAYTTKLLSNLTETSSIPLTISKNSKTVSTKARRKLDSPEKIQKRKQQVKIASKSYRERKKLIEESLIAKIKELEGENRIIHLELKKNMELTQRLREENDKIKQVNLEESADILQKRKEIIEKKS